MAKNDVERVTEEKIEKGGILVKLYFDMQDKDKEKLQPLLVDLVNERLMKENGIVYCYGEINDPIEHAGMYSASAIITVLFDNFIPLIGIAFKYAPAGIEVLKPEKGMHFKANELQSMLMDLSQISLDYSKFILEKAMTPEEVAEIRRKMENRADIGKKLMQDKVKKEKDKEEKKE